MKKRVFRYFFDFTDGQEKWLNEMAAKGWRLVKCGQLTYDFERCEPGEYEYAVEFVADKSYAKSRDYKAFLESMGYKTFYKNVYVGIFFGIKWRPWGEGAGQIATAPGSLRKELIIVEKKNDGKSFELHTDLTDLLTLYRKIRMAYFWYAGGMFAFALLLLFYTVRTNSLYMALGAALFGALGFLWLIPGLKTSQKVRKLKEEAETNEIRSAIRKEKSIEIDRLIWHSHSSRIPCIRDMVCSRRAARPLLGPGNDRIRLGQPLERKVYRIERSQAAAFVPEGRHSSIYDRNHYKIGRIGPFHHGSGRNGVL